MVTETNPYYWDCECKTDYQHKKTDTLYCVKCNSYEDDQPDSRVNELLALKNICPDCSGTGIPLSWLEHLLSSSPAIVALVDEEGKPDK